jgi:hypothetical protein
VSHLSHPSVVILTLWALNRPPNAVDVKITDGVQLQFVVALATFTAVMWSWYFAATGSIT